VANAAVPLDQTTRKDPQALLRHVRIQRTVSLMSPMQLYNDATGIIIDPTRRTTRSLVLMGPMERLSSARFERPLELSQSIFVVIPHMISLIAITFICFGVSYAVFMKQEIRSL
jgi:ABC-2 type transport system permease protein